MTEAEVIPLRGGPMDEASYDQERKRIHDIFGDSGGEAKLRWEQSLAILFHRSSWTQERLAKKEGRTQAWVSYWLLFGRFLASRENITTGYNLTERRFRDHWARTDKAQPERDRFKEVERLLAEADDRRISNHSNAIGKAIREKFMDGKWHTTAAIAKAIGQSEAEVAETLDNAHGRGEGNARYKVEKKQRPRGVYDYRLFPKDKTISLLEVIEKLTPIIEKLRTEGKKHIAQATIIAASHAAHDLEQLLKEWSE